MASYKYTTEIYRDNNLVYCGNFKSLKEQVNMLLTDERFSKSDIDYTVTEYTKALRKKNCSKRKYFYAYHNGNGDVVKLIRIGTEKQ